MSLNDTSVHPTGALGVEYAGVMNPSTASTHRADDAYASAGDLSGHVQPASNAAGEARDTIEGKPGIIESSELAPLGEDKVVDDPSLVTRATGAAKNALRSAGADV
ncbi:hypothetical protein Q5752_003624 [Cryptotrichosporon argae]